MSLYLWLNLLSLSIPLAYSFERKMRFIRWFKEFFLALSITAFIFIVWDIAFTLNGVWGFNSEYLLGISLFSLPIEEWLFFICIPYASLFIHYAFKHFFPEIALTSKFTLLLTLVFLTMAFILVIFNIEKAYTFYNFLFLFILLLISLFIKKSELKVFYITFLIILIPFFVVNGILTGSFIEGEVVWYNNDENLGLRLGTIPIEDIAYAFNMLYLSLLLFEFFKRKKRG